jgi:hypothetical protein
MRGGWEDTHDEVGLTYCNCADAVLARPGIPRVSPAGTVLYSYDEAGHLIGEYDGSGSLIEETVWLGDIPVAALRPSGSTVDVYYVHTDQIEHAPRRDAARGQSADVDLVLRRVLRPVGTDAANENPAGAGTFPYNLRFPGQVFCRAGRTTRELLQRL